jgi:NAD(P)-dependent dehydrogenase (short-subunit alcohol dehydrogenase family)
VSDTSLNKRFDLSGRVVIVTGGVGLLGSMHVDAIAEAGGIPVIADIDEPGAVQAAASVQTRFSVESLGVAADVTSSDSIKHLLDAVVSKFGRVDVLINNAASNPKVEEPAEGKQEWSRFENFPIAEWHRDISIGLTGAFLCSQVIGAAMASATGGVILNIASDLALISPDQRIYRNPNLPESLQAVKPVSYSVVKGALITLTKYLATYWAEKGVRVNAISPGGIYNGQPADFVERLAHLIPMGRMADRDEYKAAVIFLISDASSYMTGANLVIDGGRTVW